jgi:general secretion pathway protein H
MAEPSPPTGHRGFTLIEILAVLIIIGVVSALAVISVRSLGRSSDPAGQTATRLAGLIELASENARLENIQYGLIIKPQHYEFTRFINHAWIPVSNDPVFRKRDLPAGLSLSITVQNPIRIPQPATVNTATPATAAGTVGTAQNRDKDHLQPQIAILSTGEMTPFTLRLTNSDHSVYVLRGDGNGQVHIEPPNAASATTPEN